MKNKTYLIGLFLILSIIFTSCTNTNDEIKKVKNVNKLTLVEKQDLFKSEKTLNDLFNNGNLTEKTYKKEMNILFKKYNK